MGKSDFASWILDWHRVHGRKDLPWQHKISPYRVWVSEIMLQQTQVNTVIPYFNRFMAEFPDVQELANATLDKVLGYWSGLGYYARARHMHRAAVIIHTAGTFPNTLESLCELPGVGRSTAGAILSIAFEKPAAILDGNVKRVLSRFHGVDGWPGNTSISQKLWTLSELNTPRLHVGEYTQGIMDLGATVCKRRQPDCKNCPLQLECYARKYDSTEKIPAPRPKKDKPSKHCYMLFLKNNQGDIFLNKRPPVGIWSNLWCPPEFASKQEIYEWCKPFKISNYEWLATKRHTFSHFHLDYSPVVANVESYSDSVTENNQSLWQNPAKTELVGLPTPITRLLQLISK